MFNISTLDTFWPQVISGGKQVYSKTCLKRPIKNRQNKDLNHKWQLNEGRKYTFDLY